jgi:hypothetical protein
VATLEIPKAILLCNDILFENPRVALAKELKNKSGGHFTNMWNESGIEPPLLCEDL